MEERKSDTEVQKFVEASIILCGDPNCRKMYHTALPVGAGEILPCGHPIAKAFFSGGTIKKALAALDLLESRHGYDADALNEFYSE
jgi:hypothetical protein